MKSVSDEPKQVFVNSLIISLSAGLSNATKTIWLSRVHASTQSATPKFDDDAEDDKKKPVLHSLQNCESRN